MWVSFYIYIIIFIICYVIIDSRISDICIVNDINIVIIISCSICYVVIDSRVGDICSIKFKDIIIVISCCIIINSSVGNIGVIYGIYIYIIIISYIIYCCVICNYVVVESKCFISKYIIIIILIWVIIRSIFICDDNFIDGYLLLYGIIVIIYVKYMRIFLCIYCDLVCFIVINSEVFINYKFIIGEINSIFVNIVSKSDCIFCFSKVNSFLEGVSFLIKIFIIFINKGSNLNVSYILFNFLI